MMMNNEQKIMELLLENKRSYDAIPTGMRKMISTLPDPSTLDPEDDESIVKSYDALVFSLDEQCALAEDYLTTSQRLRDFIRAQLEEAVQRKRRGF